MSTLQMLLIWKQDVRNYVKKFWGQNIHPVLEYSKLLNNVNIILINNNQRLNNSGKHSQQTTKHS